jgi:translation initiation factor IF-3
MHKIAAKQPQVRLNHAIRAPELRVIDADGTQLGVMRHSEALQRAQADGLDLVEVSPNANPPVARIVDWGKYNYQKTKQAQKQKKQQKNVDIKQVRLGMRIGEHDLDIKLNRTRKFLDEGHKVKWVLMYKGRENAHKELGFTLLEKITAQLGDIAVVDQQPQLSGRSLTLVYRKNPAYRPGAAPKPATVEEPAAQPAEEQSA